MEKGRFVPNHQQSNQIRSCQCKNQGLSIHRFSRVSKQSEKKNFNRPTMTQPKCNRKLLAGKSYSIWRMEGQNLLNNQINKPNCLTRLPWWEEQLSKCSLNLHQLVKSFKSRISKTWSSIDCKNIPIKVFCSWINTQSTHVASYLDMHLVQRGLGWAVRLFNMRHV